MRLPTNELVALLVTTSFAAGLNVYATLATLGLLAHSGLLLSPLNSICCKTGGFVGTPIWSKNRARD